MPPSVSATFLVETFTQRAMPTATVPVVSAAVWVVPAAATVTAMVAALLKSVPSQRRRRVAAVRPVLNPTPSTVRPEIAVVRVKWEAAALVA